MYKALGVVFIFLSLGVYLNKSVEEKRAEILNLKEFYKALTVLKNELKFSMPEMPHLLKKVSEKSSGKISYIFKEMEEKVTAKSDIDFFTAWESVTEGKTLFSKEASCVILNFCQNFGKKTLDIELDNIKKCENDLNELIKEESDKFKKDRKLIYTLGISIGAVIVILGI